MHALLSFVWMGRDLCSAALFWVPSGHAHVFMTRYPKRRTLRTYRQRAVQREPTLIVTRTASQTICGRQMRPVNSVVPYMVWAALPGSAPYGATSARYAAHDTVGIDLDVAKDLVGRLGLAYERASGSGV